MISSLLLGISGTATVAVTSVFLYHIFWLSSRRKGEPPVMQTLLPYLGHALQMGQRPTELIQECASKCKDIFGLVLLGQRMFFLTDCVNTGLLFRNSKEFSVDEFFEVVEVNFFNIHRGMVRDDTAELEAVRRLYTKYLFSEEYLGELTDRFKNGMESALSSYGPVASVPLYDFIHRVFFHTSFITLFSDREGGVKELYDAYRTTDSLLPITNAGVHISSFPTAFKAIKQLAGIVKGYESSNNISSFIKARFDHFRKVATGTPEFEEEIGKYQYCMLWAATANAAPTVFWLIYYLLKNPEHLQKVREEISQSLPADYKDIRLEHLNKMIYTDAVITETLRFSGSNMIVRKAMREGASLTLASGATYTFRKGDAVALYPLLFYNDPELFPEPKRFNPQRWIVGDTEADRMLSAQGKIDFKKNGVSIPSANVFLPFGGGVTMCPGRKLARNEIKLMAVTLFHKFSTVLENASVIATHDNARCGFGVVPPAKDVQVKLSPL